MAGPVDRDGQTRDTEKGRARHTGRQTDNTHMQ